MVTFNSYSVAGVRLLSNFVSSVSSQIKSCPLIVSPPSDATDVTR